MERTKDYQIAGFLEQYVGIALTRRWKMLTSFGDFKLTGVTEVLEVLKSCPWRGSAPCLDECDPCSFALTGQRGSEV
jgi:hypothetical protein